MTIQMLFYVFDSADSVDEIMIFLEALSMRFFLSDFKTWKSTAFFLPLQISSILVFFIQKGEFTTVYKEVKGRLVLHDNNSYEKSTTIIVLKFESKVISPRLTEMTTITP